MEAEPGSRDLLQRFAGSATLTERPPSAPSSPSSGNVELSLGLSLGGCFSSNPREHAGKLIRSSSIAAFPFLDTSIKEENFPVPPAPVPLHRTCSLPVPGTDEEYRKRKEMQTLKRLEAKRKRTERRNNSLKGDEPRLPPLSQGSIGAGGSSISSGGGSMQGLDGVRYGSTLEAKSSQVSERANHRAATDDKNSKKIERKGSGLSMVEDMPCVSTRGNGPNGKRIEGLLYKYRKGEEVRIVCVCHGNFLTPAEFVRHAGGGDVDHPLKHIVVNPPSPFL